MKLISRDFYLGQPKDALGTPDIKVITGVRRSEKSKLLEAFKEYVEENITDANIIHINYSLRKFEELAEYMNMKHLEEMDGTAFLAG